MAREARRLRAGVPGGRQRGLGLLEILIALAVVALAGVLLLRYLDSTARTAETLRRERPLGSARLAADQATLATLQQAVRAHQARTGRWPADRAEALALLPGAPRFQCQGNDVEYDGATGQLRLAIADPSRC